MSALTMYRGCCEGLGAGAGRIPEREGAWTEGIRREGSGQEREECHLDRRMPRQKPRGVRAQEFQEYSARGVERGVIEME